MAVATKRKASKAKASAGITMHDAWVALGSSEEFKPKDMTKPASAPMLYRLNVEGKLSIG